MRKAAQVSHHIDDSMKHLFILSVCIAYLPFISQTTLGQKSDAPRIPSIPHALFWENKPAAFTLIEGTLMIKASAKTDMFRDPNVTYNTDNAPKLLFKPDENFILSAYIEHTFISKWDGGALVIKQDSRNWVKFCFEKDYTGVKRVVSVVTKGVSDDCNSVAIQGNSVHFKLAKADNVITLYYSTNGKNWFLVRHLQFDLKPGFSVGFLAQSPTGTSASVRFSKITYQARKIKDPYLGY